MSRSRAVFSLFFAASLSSCAIFSPPPPKAVPRPVRQIERAFLEETLARRKVGGVTMKAYNTGHVRTRGRFVSSMKSLSAKVRLDAPVFLVRHPAEGLILFDAGLDSRTASDLSGGWLSSIAASFESRPGEDIAGQLKADGVDPAEVRWIMLSHLHRDHLAGVDAFARATVLVSRKEWDSQKAKYAAKPDSREFDPASREATWRLRFLDLETQPPYGAFDHGVDVFSDGTVFAVALPGHTAGSMGAWVNLDGGPVLLAGDAAWVVDNVMDEALPNERGYQGGLTDYLHSIQEMRAMQNAVPRLVIFPGHDLTPRTLTDRDDLPLAPFPR